MDDEDALGDLFLLSGARSRTLLWAIRAADQVGLARVRTLDARMGTGGSSVLVETAVIDSYMEDRAAFPLLADLATIPYAALEREAIEFSGLTDWSQNAERSILVKLVGGDPGGALVWSTVVGGDYQFHGERWLVWIRSAGRLEIGVVTIAAAASSGWAERWAPRRRA